MPLPQPPSLARGLAFCCRSSKRPRDAAASAWRRVTSARSRSSTFAAPALGVRQRETALPARWPGLCGLHLGLALLGQSALVAFPVDCPLTALVVRGNPDLRRRRPGSGAPRRARHVLSTKGRSAPTHKSHAAVRTPLLRADKEATVPLRVLRPPPARLRGGPDSPRARKSARAHLNVGTDPLRPRTKGEDAPLPPLKLIL